ncbi:PP2C family protein-serine/threonine phosphatase [Cellulosimicrobium cellulans]|uniref:PP2C family protein-serine/threonine phosphatase n=1 Tax=Cellulosimicrobium cellulans TaxID=1710 RepID=UPI000AFF75A8|nr:SpoIIE family protein phosphatase [Cellulosimicrobium cellulans]
MTDATATAAREDARVLALHRLGVLDTAPEERFERVTRLAQRLFGVPTVSITLVDTDRQWRKAFIGLDGPVAQREGAFCDVTIQEDRTLVVEDAAADARFADNPFVVDDPHLRFYAGHPLAAPGGERVGTLCVIDTLPRRFDDADRALLRDLALWVQGELQRDEEIDRAGAVQRGLLPRRAPALEGYRIAARCVPARGVGGDFYDWTTTADGAGLILADVMGKGMAAAIVAASARAALRTAVRVPGLAPGVEAADESLAADLEEVGSFVTAWCATVERETGRVTFVDAGHGLASVLRADGGVERLDADGLPLGVAPELPREADEVTLGPGDRLVVVSDGLVDLLADLGVPGGDPRLVDPDVPAPGPHGEDLARFARDVRRAPDAATTLSALVGIAAGRHLPDDLTALVLERVGA